MRVRFVSPLWPNRSLVGSWITSAEFGAHLVRAGHEVSVAAYLASGGDWNHDGMTVTCGLSRARETPADVVIGHAGDNGSAALVAGRLGVPLVVMVHGGTPEAIRAKLAGAELVVFNSRALADAVAWPGRYVVAHPPIRPERYTTTPGGRVTLANLSGAKGGELFWALAAALPKTAFLGIRGHYGTQILRRNAGNVLVDRPAADVALHVYRRTRILLLPSEAETWGRVALEAACSGIPTIAHPHPGVLEAMGEAAMYVDRNDTAGWVEAIGALGDPGYWAQMSAAAVERSRRLDPDEQLGRFTDALEEVAACVSLS